MARMDTSGLTELISEMQRMGQTGGEVARAMTLAAADEIAEAWRESAQAHELIDTGDMLESIGFPEGVQQIGSVFFADIYPQGKDRTGTRNAEKAYILNYGSSRIKPTYWVDEADRKAEEKVVSRLEDMWGQFLETGSVPAAPEVTPTGKKQTGAHTERKK